MRTSGGENYNNTSLSKGRRRGTGSDKGTGMRKTKGEINRKGKISRETSQNINSPANQEQGHFPDVDEK